MSQKSLQPKITELQKDVLLLLRQTNSLLGNIITRVGTDQLDEKFKEMRRSIRLETKKVKKLELIMSVVAPMKAGKSTIVNAIVGHNILPSRNSAMTTLPTQIFFSVDDEAQEKLLLPVRLVSKFTSTINKLHQAVSSKGLDVSKNKLSNYPHLQVLLEKIYHKKESVFFREEVKGREAILSDLMALNDIVRLCNVFSPSASPLKNLTNVPQILTPIWRENKSDDIDQLGNLIIVDTPGPNEASANHQLLEVVQNQLRASSVVLIVLDFTQLKNIAAEEVKQEVQKVISVKGKENLFVLINKVDQRRKGDMSPKEVEEFVRAEFGIENTEQRKRVFEVAAIWAFSATNFLREVNKNPEVSLNELDSAEAFAKEALGPMWEMAFEEISKEELIRKANFLWKKSGFPIFLESVIDELMIKVAPKTINSALNTTSSYLHEIRSYLRLRKTGILKDKKELKRQVSALIEDIEEIEKSRNKIPSVQAIKSKLQKKTSLRITEAKSVALVSLDTYFDREDYKRSSLLGKVVITFTKPLLKRLPSLSDNQKSFEFKSKTKAKNFSNKAVDIAIQRASKVLDEIQIQTDQDIEGAISRLLKVLRKETGPIIKRAQERLKKSFQLDLVIPELEGTIITEVESIRPDIKTETKTTSGGYGTEKIMKRTWRRLWLWKTEVEVKYKKPDVHTEYYVVSLEQLIQDVNKQIESSFDNNSQNIIRYLDEDLQDYINVFYDNLDRYLSTYKESLSQSQDDQELAEKEKELLLETLTELIEESGATDKLCKKYTRYLAQITTD